MEITTMDDTELHDHAQDIHEELPDTADVSSAEIQQRLTTLVDDYQVPLEEARRTILSTYFNETDTDGETLDRDNEHVDLNTINEAEQWVDITAKLVELWEPQNDAIAQVGLLGDETGTIKFTKWAKSDLPKLTEEHVYTLENVVTDEYQGQYSVKLNRTTNIQQLDQTIEVGDNTTTAEGALIDIQTGSGLIKRCPNPDCTRVLQNGRCSEHGEAEGDFDLRIKAVLDDGTTVQEVIFDQETTEQLTGITLQQAQQRAMDALDTSVVTDDIRELVLGNYYQLKGPILGRYLLVNEFEQCETMHDPDPLLVRARSL